jgi:WD40 repeat protein/DNA-binding SARP family transcriptional activator
MTQLTLTFLGSFTVTADGHPIPHFATDKVRALLVYLALEAGQPHSRPALAALLWPEVANKYALHNLRNTLHRLRQSLDKAWPDLSEQLLTITRQTIQFQPDLSPASGLTLTLDVTTFQTLLAASQAHPHPRLADCSRCLAQLAQAMNLYRGELLAGFGLADAPPFEEWLTLRREMLQQQALMALKSLADAYETQAAYDQAFSFAQRLLQLDTYREDTHRQLMRLLALRGLPDQALAQYESCRQLLREELGVEPAAETDLLREQIRQGKRPPSSFEPEAAPPAMATPKPARPPSIVSATATIPPPNTAQSLLDVPDPGPFFGRRAELAQLQHWLIDEGCRLVAILGLGGMGKTTLAAQAVRILSDHFDLVLWRSLLNAPPLEELLPPLLQTLSDQQLTEMPQSIDEQLRLLLTYLHNKRVLLVLDNLESILNPKHAGAYRPGYETYGQLIQQVATLAHQSQLLLTSRERPGGYARLERDGPLIYSLPLTGLDDQAGHKLLAQRGLRGVGGKEAMLIDRYSGNPLALKLVADSVDELFGGDLNEFLANDSFIFDDIRTVLDQHFDRLTELEQQILFWLAVEREPTSLRSLHESLLRPSKQRDLMEALRSLLRRSLIERPGADFALQNVVTEYLTERLIECVVAEIESGALHRLCQQALLKALAKDYVRESQARLILRPIGEQLIDRMGLTGLQAKIQQILSDLRANTAQARHYAVGALLNLLLALEIDVRGYDFSELSIWQANLQNATLHDVSFRGANFMNTLFADSFGAITGLALDPQDVHLASAANGDSFIRLWRLHDGQLIATLAGHSQTCTSLDFHPDGHLLASGSADQTVRLWDVESGRPVATLQGHQCQVETVVFSPNGEFLASGGPGAAVCIWAVKTGQRLATLPPHQGFLRPIVYHPDGQTLVTKSVRDIYFWSLKDLSAQTSSGQVSLTKTLQPPDMAALCFAFSPDGSQLAIGTEEGPVLLWDMEQERFSPPFKGHTVPVIDVTFSPDGQLVASSSRDGTVRLWDIASGKPLDILRGHLGAVWGMRISANGKTLVSGGADGIIRLWELRSASQRRIRRTIRGNLRELRGIAISAESVMPDGIMLAAGSKNGRCHLWRLNPQSVSKIDNRNADGLDDVYLDNLRGHVGSINCIAFRAHSAELATAGDDHTVRIWDVARKQCLVVLQEPTADVRALTYNSQGTILASASGDGIIHVWAIDDRGHHQLRYIIQEPCASEVLAVSPDEKTLVYALVNNTIVLRDIENGETLHRVNESSAAWALDIDASGRRLVTGHLNGTINLWEVADRRLVTPPRLLGHHKQAIIHTVRFSPGGGLVVSGGFDRTLYVWDLATGQARHQLDMFNEGIHEMRFLPNSNILLVACLDGAVRICDVEDGVLLHTLHVAGPYEGMNISGVTGISEAQRAALKTLGAVEEHLKSE